ncbi:putative unsaturated glucuronyl hydrolase [Opitutaceae bacterium TAV1]|nr:putative unsaturated glucuronyl hydrolase [Opitutaceae bacterium TAV1]
MFLAATDTSGLPVQPPLRAPFGWPTVGLAPPAGTSATGGSVLLTWPHAGNTASSPGASRGGWLRIGVSVDDREQKIVTASLARTGAMIGQFDLRYSHSIEPWQIQLNATTLAAALEQGIRLTLTHGSTPLWLFAPGLPAGAEVLAPHLLPDVPADAASPDAASAAFFRVLGSVGSVQTFGWMEGCILDALHDLRTVATGTADVLRWRAALDAHLALFFTPDGHLVYEDPRGRPCDDRIYGIEGTLPFAVLAKVAPHHPLLDTLLAWYRDHLHPDGTFRNPESYTAEGSYTIAYPLAAIAGQRRDNSLASLAINVLRQRQERLRRPDGLWLRRHSNDSRTFRSWARGIAWYLLGLGRSLEHLRGLADTGEPETELRAAVAWTLALQREDGLWGCFADDPACPPDTSGSAGIAAAIMRAARAGFVDAAEAETAARRCWSGLLPHLTPDGLLDGTAQSNRGGEALQRAPYRVLSPMGMGLMGQLAAALDLPPPSP